MKLFRSVSVACLFVCLSVAAQAQDPPRTADQDWAELEAQGLVKFDLPENFRTLSGRQKRDWLEAQAYRVQAAGMAFYMNHPADPRRWQMVNTMAMQAPLFVIAYGPDIERNHNDVTSNQAAVKAWQACLDALAQRMRAAPDATPELIEQTDYSLFSARTLETYRLGNQGLQVDWPALLDQAQAYLAAWPDSRMPPSAVLSRLSAFERFNPLDKTVQVWQRFSTSPNKMVADAMARKLQLAQFASRPMDLTFTAADGREVDLAKLRGKVVLIDFWATWCGPCKEDIPTVRDVYERYRERGFEIVGIALEGARVASGDTAEQAATKLAASRQKLLDFVTHNRMPWPQYFDGKHWQTELSARFAINSIPTMFLLDREGKLVSSSIAAAALEAAVKSLLP